MIGENHLEEPIAALMLPTGEVLVADCKKGLLLFCGNGNLIKETRNEAEWRWPQGLQLDAKSEKFYVSVIRKQTRAIAVFSFDLKLLEFLPGPPIKATEGGGTKESLAFVPETQELYLSIADSNGSEIWHCVVGRDWNLVNKRPGALWTDLKYMLIGKKSIVDLVMVEAKMGYIHKLSVKGSDILERKAVAAVAKPNSVCVDEKKHVFVHDLETGKISVLDEWRWVPMRDICVIDKEIVHSITAANGHLGVALKERKRVIVYRYDDIQLTLGH